jgi:hypothetical protein
MLACNNPVEFYRTFAVEYLFGGGGVTGLLRRSRCIVVILVAVAPSGSGRGVANGR